MTIIVNNSSYYSFYGEEEQVWQQEGRFRGRRKVVLFSVLDYTVCREL
jgi:hypothetical protein